MNWIFIILIIIGIIFIIKKINSFENFQDLGIKKYRQGKFSESIAYLEKAIKKKPNHSETICALGDAYFQKSLIIEPLSSIASKMYERKAVEYFEKYLELEPNGYHKENIIQKLEIINNK